MANILKIDLSSSGLFGNPGTIEIKEPSFSQIHKLVSTYDTNNMVKVLETWVEIMCENLVSPQKVDFGNFTVDEMTEVLILNHFNFINTGLQTPVVFEKSGSKVVSLTINDIKFNKLTIEGDQTLEKINIKKGNNILTGTSLRVKDMISAFRKSSDYRKNHRAKNFETYRSYEVATESGRENSLSEKIKTIVEEGSTVTRRILDESLIAGMIVSFNEINVSDNLDKKIELLKTVPPGLVLALEKTLTEKFYHGPSKDVIYEGEKGRCSFQLPNIIQAMREPNLDDYEIDLG